MASRRRAAFAAWAALAVLSAVPAAAKSSPPNPEEARWAAHVAATQIVRDRLGIAHVRGVTDADAVFAMVYAQAEDDFPRIETNYLTALGRLAEAEGEGALWSDLRQRLWIDEAELKRLYGKVPVSLRLLMDAWADGLNFYLRSHPDVRPRVLSRFEPWMALSFSEGSIGGDIEYVDLAALRALYDKASPAVSSAPEWREPQGSNGIAIGPSRSASGHPLLLINPHTSLFFRDVVHVKSAQGLDVFGAVTWGQFFVYQGFNRDAGWMHTSSGLDNRDEFAVTLQKMADGRLGYRFGSELRPIGMKPVILRFRTASGALAERTFTTMNTLHGPIVRSEAGRLVAYAIMNDPGRALEQSFTRTKAANLREFLAASALRANTSNNTIYADRHGTIAYLHPQFVPLRDGRFDYRGVVDGSDPRTQWRGLHSIDSLPRIVDPPSGYVFNVNDAPWPAAGKATLEARRYPSYMDQWGWNPRTDHALALLEGDRAFTLQGLADVAYDTANPGFDRLIPTLLAAYDSLPRRSADRARLAEPVALLRDWDRHWSTSSEALTLAIHWAEALWDEVMGADRPPNDEEVGYARMAASSPRAKLAALDQAVKRLNALYGRWRVPWGSINRLQRNDGAIVQRFDDSKPSLAVGFPSARWGSLASFGAKAYPGTTRRYGTSGNSFVAVVEFTQNGPRALAVTAGGISGDPRSPHFFDQATAYAEGRLFPVALEPAEVAAAAVETYRPGESRIRP